MYLVQSRIDDAILWLEKARVAAPDLPWVHLRLASAYSLKGETKRAAAELAEAQRNGRHDLSIGRLKAGLSVLAQDASRLRNNLLRRPAQGWGARAMKTTARCCRPT